MLLAMDSSITRPCSRRSSGTRPIPPAIAATGAPFLRSWPRTCTLPASYRSIPKTVSRYLAPPRTDQPCQSHYLPAAYLEGNIHEHSFSGQPLNSHDYVPGLGVVSFPALHHVPSDHSPYQVFRSQAFERTGKYALSVAYDRDALADLEHLFQTVRDEQARPRRRRGGRSTTRKSRCTSYADRRRRLVHDDYPRFERKRLCLFRLSAGPRSISHERSARGRGARPEARVVQLPAGSYSCVSTRRALRSGCRPINTFSATVRSGKSVGSW